MYTVSSRDVTLITSTTYIVQPKLLDEIGYINGLTTLMLMYEIRQTIALILRGCFLFDR